MVRQGLGFGPVLVQNVPELLRLSVLHAEQHFQNAAQRSAKPRETNCKACFEHFRFQDRSQNSNPTLRQPDLRAASLNISYPTVPRYMWAAAVLMFVCSCGWCVYDALIHVSSLEIVVVPWCAACF
jgi:hypothetical protein